MQGVALNHRTRLLLDGRTGQYSPKRHGCRKRKSVRGCIVGSDMSCINVTITKRGETDLPKLTDKASDRPSVRGPKRAGNIRKAWGLTKKDDVRQYVVKKVKPGKDGKKDRIKSPKIQRLITPLVKRRRKNLLRANRQQKETSRKEAADYAKLLKQLRAEKRTSLLSKRRELRSQKASSTTATTEKKSEPVQKKGTKTEEKKVVKATEKKATATKPTTDAPKTKTVTPKTTGAKTSEKKATSGASKKEQPKAKPTTAAKSKAEKK